MLLVEDKLLDHLRIPIARRKDLEDDLGGNSSFDPLHVRPPVALGTPEDDHRIGCLPDLGMTLDRIPEQVAGDEDVGPITEDPFQALLDGDDPAKLDGVLRHRLSIVLGINDPILCRQGRRNAHEWPLSALSRTSELIISQLNPLTPGREFQTSTETIDTLAMDGPQPMIGGSQNNDVIRAGAPISTASAPEPRRTPRLSTRPA